MVFLDFNVFYIHIDHMETVLHLGKVNKHSANSLDMNKNYKKQANV